jgi:hypothetical protein
METHDLWDFENNNTEILPNSTVHKSWLDEYSDDDVPVAMLCRPSDAVPSPRAATVDLAALDYSSDDDYNLPVAHMLRQPREAAASSGKRMLVPLSDSDDEPIDMHHNTPRGDSDGAPSKRRALPQDFREDSDACTESQPRSW